MALASATPSLPVYGNWQATGYHGEMHLGPQSVILDGDVYFQKDGASGYNRSAYISKNKNAMSTMADWDGKTTGTPATYYHNTKACYYWCPVDETTASDDQCNDQTALCGYDQLHRAKYVRDDVMGSTNVQVYFYTDPLGPIAMANTTLFIGTKTQTPYAKTMYFTPFGQYEGYSNQTYGDFVNQTPDDSAFVVPNTKYCQQGDDSQCGEGSYHKKITHMLGGMSPLTPSPPAPTRVEPKKEQASVM